MRAPQAIVLLKSEALCLNVRPFSKTSQMVTWLTADYGRVTTPVKGAMRPKSQFVGRYDVGYTCELVFYAHERNGVHHIRECSPLHLREALRTRWRSATAAAYLCDLTLRTAQSGLANDALYQALSHALDALQVCDKQAVALVLLWFECRLLKALGVVPDFAGRCTQCEPSPRASFSVEEGRFICQHHPSRLRHPPTLTLHYEVSDLFAQLVETSLELILAAARASSRTDDLGRPEPFPGIFGLRRFLGIFLVAHLDLLPGPRRTVLDVLIG